MQLKPNALLQGGKYRIERMLGQGGFSITYLGTQVALNRKVAIKEFFMKEYCERDLRTGEVSTSNCVKAYMYDFVKTAQLAAGVLHPNIVYIYDIFEENGTAYYVADYIEDGDLMGYLHSRPSKRMSEDDVLQVAVQIGGALSFLHSKNIFHLGVTPLNILIDKKAKKYFLEDFGLAIKKSQDDTSDRPIGYSPIYAPLEQQGNHIQLQLAPTLDIYALGATLYTLLTGERPPRAETLFNEGFPDTLSKLGISQKMQTAITKAMNVKYKARPQSVDEFLHLLSDDKPKEQRIHSVHEDEVLEETKIEVVGAERKYFNVLPLGTLLHGHSYTYEIVKVLGQGTFGISYLANVRLSGALGELQSTVQVAIKEFFMKDVNGRQGHSVTSGSDSEIYRNYRNDFIREANNLARMKHPHIVKVLEAFEANNTCYFSMEYINGGNLNEYIMQCQSLSERQALQGIVEIGEALSFMHDNKMLHLDLKPLNVMRRKDGGLVLIDFGLSKQFDRNGEPESSTRIGGGTIGYAPLEQANYRKGEGFPATLDIYALGATLLKMLTGKTPADASTLFNEGFPEEELRQCGVSDEVIKLVAWAMEPMKRKRPQTVKAFLDEAKRLLPDCSDTKKEWDINGTEPLPVGFQLRSDSSVYEIVECLSKDACSYVYKAVRKGRENEDVILLENMPNEFMGGRVGGSSGRYEIDFSISDYDEWTGLFQEKVKRLSKSCRVLERFGVGYATFLVSFPAPIKKELLDACLVKKKSKEQFSINKQDFIHGHECVDLGLSVKWATCNIGAEKPEDYGDYFAWGETSTKSEYYDSNSLTYEKNFSDIAGNSNYDAARANWGGSWRLPTKAECQELVDKCTWTWTYQGGHNGYKVVGPNGNSIFLPAAGWRYGTSLGYDGVYGYYWISTPYEGNTQNACNLRFDSGYHRVCWYYRYYGRSVRPVSE